MIDSTNPRIMADSIRALHGTVTTQGNALEALGSYSATEVNTGMKYGDSDIYRKIFEIESFPNNTAVNIQHEITNLDKMLLCYGIVYHKPGVDSGRMFVGSTNPGLTFSATYLYLKTTTDMSNMAGCIVLEYTKSAAPSTLTSPAPDVTRSIEPEEIPEDEYIEPEVIREAPEEEPIEELVQEVKKATRKKSTN